MVSRDSPPSTLSTSDITKIPAGGGSITLAVHGARAVFEELSSAYPLKLLSPQVYERDVAIVYLLSYGGGLVAGDRVELDVKLKEGSKLLVLSQGSTKVFKTRPGQRLASIRANGAYTALPTPTDDSLTTQTIRYTLLSKSSLFLLPDPVTCFRSASYNQIQTFNLAPDSSVVILDWLTSGRKALDEDWAFTRYYSENEVIIGDKRWAKDAMLLEADRETAQNVGRLGPLPRRTLGERLAPYSCYAMVLLYGQQVQKIIEKFRARFEAITVFKRGMPEDVIWSFSPIGLPGAEGCEGTGAVVRVAGKETELVKGWLKEGLKGIEEVMGADVYRRAFA
ncbi:UreD-domain-containing protein [Macrolepiota fuliginosa MF-IS2]|uniref:UreD-domain-containing protein n=1 Tax=Macrolepiota fuliginosa MF-IS2 TaxID=1400762 RepID=A0A9P5XSS0_9AGAR|nr:UreD-domain-containing protein [Macrolepiota fuliginosa MF-IS2]